MNTIEYNDAPPYYDLSDAEKADIRNRWLNGEQAWESHDRGECALCDELRRLDEDET